MNLQTPKHIVAVSAFVTNTAGEVLLVKTNWRSDTWEMPGGQVEEGEPLDIAVCRETKEETGMDIRPIGITGVYYNTNKHVFCVVFRAELLGGELQPQADEIMDVRFVSLSEENLEQYIRRPQQQSRTLDAIRAHQMVPYETWNTLTTQMLGRLDPGMDRP